jgi:hypothetical protein
MRHRLRSHSRPHSLAVLVALALSIAAACREVSGPPAPKTTIATLAGDAQFGTIGQQLAEPLQVVVNDAVTHQPREGIRVDWQVTEGGGSVTPASATTDTRGIATAQLRLGGALGSNRVRATAVGQVGDPATFTLTAIVAPAITAVTPGTARAGDTITISGTNFGTTSSVVAVLFDGVRGQVISIADGQLRAVVPACVATHTAVVRVALGSVLSAPTSLATIAGNTGPLRLARGEVRVFADPADLQCVRLPPDPAGASYLIITQNAAQTYSIPMQSELAAFGVQPPPIALRAGMSAGGGPTPDFASTWELALRARERLLTAGAPPLPLPQAQLRTSAADPKVGDRRSFNTLDADNKTVRITAEIKAITTRAILYEDVAAPRVYTTADYEGFGHTFDDPIYNTDTSVFGPVSDIDGNQRVIILFTPEVNALTPKGSGTFIGGYFYACDLLPANRCAATNGAEIFYSMVPDPEGKFGDRRDARGVSRAVPPIIAHEFMHMINFSERAGSLDVLWLAEALAHTAEDIVGQVFIDRGDPVTGADFIEQNHSHARKYLSAPQLTSLIADESPGTIDLRGAGWLFLRYLRGLYGENALLTKLTSAQTSGSLNVATQTGRSWPTLLADFATAIFADDMPELAGVTIDPRYTFVNTNMREMLGFPSFPLAVQNRTFADFLQTVALPSSSMQYTLLQSPFTASTTSLNLVFSGARGGPFNPTSVPQLIMMRIR